MVVSIASQKGGTGKSSTAVSLSAGLAQDGHKVLLIDIDSQANSSKVLLPDYAKLSKDDTLHRTILARQELPIWQTYMENLHIVPSHILLSNTDVELTVARDHREERLKCALDKVKDRYRYILIDCPPNLGWLTVNALTASDKVIVAISPGYFELDSVVQITKTIAEVKDFYNPDLEIWGYLFTMSDPTVNSATSLKILRQTYTDKVFNTVIPRNTDLRDAHFNKTDIFNFNPKAKAAFAYRKLIREIFYGEET